MTINGGKINVLLIILFIQNFVAIPANGMLLNRMGSILLRTVLRTVQNRSQRLLPPHPQKRAINTNRPQYNNNDDNFHSIFWWKNSNQYKPVIMIGLFLACRSTFFITQWNKLRKSSSTFNPNHMGLLDDIKYYKTTNDRWHAGNVYEHSMWLELCIEQWFHKRKFWIQNLNEQDEKVLAMAGILHDIGKAGDGELTFFTKPEHPEVGFNYLQGKSSYITTKNEVFDFNSYLNNFKFDNKQQAIIAVLVGIHHDFGSKVMSKVLDSQYSKKDIFEEYLNTLKNLAKKTGYPDIFDRKLVIMSMAITAGDVRAAQPVYYSSTMFNIPAQILPVHNGGKMYEQFNFDTKGKIIRDALLVYYDEYYQKKN